MTARMRLFLAEDSGQDMIEYVLVAGVIGLGAIASVGGVATIVKNMLTTLVTSFQSAT